MYVGEQVPKIFVLTIVDRKKSKVLIFEVFIDYYN